MENGLHGRRNELESEINSHLKELHEVVILAMNIATDLMMGDKVRN